MHSEAWFCQFIVTRLSAPAPGDIRNPKDIQILYKGINRWKAESTENTQ